MQPWHTEKILIWGKTYPELSKTYIETVCTGGTREDGGFIRLYPIPLRYLDEDSKFKKYQWIYARIHKSSEDHRPESFKIDFNHIEICSSIPTDQNCWANRKLFVFNKSAVFESVEELLDAERRDHTSLGFVKPKEIIDIHTEERPSEDRETFIRKLKENQLRSQQEDLFQGYDSKEIRNLQFITHRLKVRWKCHGNTCNTHNMSILDWEVYEFTRKFGLQSAKSKLNDLLNLDKFDIGFFLGNMKLHPTSFAIGAIWYPKRTKCNLIQDDLFA